MAGWCAVLMLLTSEPDRPANGSSDRLRGACVRVINPDGGRVGTGVAVGRRDGFDYVLTAAHVVAGAVEPQVAFAGGDSAGTVAEVVTRDAAVDVAVLRVKTPQTPRDFPPLAGMGPPGEVDEFAAKSAEFSADGPTVRDEWVLAKRLLDRGEGRAAFAWECREPTLPGRSGGPLVDEQGRVIGICIGNRGGRGYYCHQDEIAAMLRRQRLEWLIKDRK